MSNELPSPTFCAIPWVHLFADEMGVMRPCCMTLGERQHTSCDANGEPYTVFREGGIEESWNAPFMKDLRQDMLAGRRPAVCQRCFSEEDLGIESYRSYANAKHSGRIAEAVAATSAEGESPSSLIRSVDLRLGNVCNLRCRMCSPLSSRLMIDEWGEIFNSTGDPRLEELRHVDWFSRPEFWSMFEKYVSDIEMLHFGGGEPLLVPQGLDFLQRLVDTGKAGNIALSYITNLTVLPPRVFDLWSKFRRVALTISLDGYTDVNNFIRYPTRWEKLDANLRVVREWGTDLNLWVTFNTTVQAYNVLRLADIFEYTFTLAAPQVDPFPRLSLLQLPQCMSVGVLPAGMKDLAALRLRDFVAKWTGRWPEAEEGADHRFGSAVEGVIAHMNETDLQHALPELIRRNAIFDRMRGNDVRMIIPELAPLFETNG
jgi:hypothetical protein